MGLNTLRSKAVQVRNETGFKLNTAQRVGQILVDIIDYIIDLFTDKHNHNNKSVLDQLGDSDGGFITTEGGKLTYRGIVLEGVSDVGISSWINPPVIKIVTALPVSHDEGDRYILQSNGVIYTRESEEWVVDPATDPEPIEGSAVIVRLDSDDIVINAIHVYEDEEWIDKSSAISPNESLFMTNYDSINGRQLIPITGSPNDINQTGRYHGSDNVVGNPIYDVGLGASTDTVYYFHDNHNPDSAYQYAVVINSGGKKYSRRKINNVWSDWKEIDVSGDSTEDTINAADIKTNPVDADKFPLMDSEDAGKLKRVSWENIKATLYTAFEITYAMWQVVSDKVQLKTAKALNMQSKKIEGLADGTEDNDAVNKSQLDVINTDEKVKYDSTDPTAGYVADKIIAGAGISVAEGTGASENKLVVTNDDKGSDVDLTGKMDKDPTAVDVGTLTDASVFQFWKVDAIKKITWTNIKAALKSYFESVWDFGHNIFSQLETTKLTQRAKLRFKGFLKASDDSVEGETVVEIDETKTEAIEFVQKFGLDIDGDQTLDSGNTTTLADLTLTDSTKTWGVNAYADKYCVIEYTNESFYPLLKECIKIASNTTDTLTFTDERKHKAYTSVSAYEILDPLTFEGDEEPTIAAFPMTRNSVIELPTLAADNNRIDCRIYNEYQTWNDDNKRTFVFAKSTNTIFGINHIEIVDVRESVLLSQHFTAAPHWDVLIDERFEAACVRLLTAEHTMTGDDNFNVVEAADWKFGKMKGVTAAIDVQTGYKIIELHAINAIPQDIKISALLQVLLKNNGVEYEIQLAKFDGTNWLPISPVAKAETTAALREITLSTQAANTMVAGDKYRLEVKVTNAQDFDVNDCSIIISEK